MCKCQYVSAQGDLLEVLRPGTCFSFYAISVWPYNKQTYGRMQAATIYGGACESGGRAQSFMPL